MENCRDLLQGTWHLTVQSLDIHETSENFSTVDHDMLHSNQPLAQNQSGMSIKQRCPEQQMTKHFSNKRKAAS